MAPLKALVRERMIDWKVRLEDKLKKSVVELTGIFSDILKTISLKPTILYQIN